MVVSFNEAVSSSVILRQKLPNVFLVSGRQGGSNYMQNHGCRLPVITFVYTIIVLSGQTRNSALSVLPSKNWQLLSTHQDCQ
jgi:hypothetical protein